MGSVIAIGNFDGVHKGHQAVLRQARGLADSGGLRAVVLTFDPHPSEVLGRGTPPRLVTLERRIELLRANGADDVIVQRFTKELAAWTPERFAKDLLSEQLSAKVVVVGKNFRFGSKRAGDFDTLAAFGQTLGFSAVASEVAGDDDGPFSSTRVRAAITNGDVAQAARILGRPHMLSGVVAQGDRVGRTIGFPTANLEGIGEMLPAYGVYAVRVRVQNEAYLGAMNVGIRPTVNGTSLRVETHLLDFDADLYGARIECDLVERLRGEMKFDGLPALKAQIAADVARARKILG